MLKSLMRIISLLREYSLCIRGIRCFCICWYEFLRLLYIANIEIFLLLNLVLKYRVSISSLDIVEFQVL